MVHETGLGAAMPGHHYDASASSVKFFDDVSQWRSLFEEINVGRRDDERTISLSLQSDPAFLTMFGYSIRRTATAIIPRHLY